jgi:hypothetical protein
MVKQKSSCFAALHMGGPELKLQSHQKRKRINAKVWAVGAFQQEVLGGSRWAWRGGGEQPTALRIVHCLMQFKLEVWNTNGFCKGRWRWEV